MKQKIGLVYYISGGMGKKIDYIKAQSIASQFTYDQLLRIWLKIQRK